MAGNLPFKDQEPGDDATNTDSGLRFACFMVLLMVWKALQCDDLQSIDPSTVSFSQLGLKFLLHRTKTSGPEKKQDTLQLHPSWCQPDRL